MVFLGNINQPVELLVRIDHLFQPLPSAMRDDMALIDRFHCYLPGWEVPKMAMEYFTDHYGFVVDYLAEALRELRRQNFTDVLDVHFSLGSHLNARDAKATRKTVAGLVKLLHPDRQVQRDELAEYLELALECRRRVKEQLKKMGSFEFYQTSFSYLDQETMQERFVGVPEEGGRNLISPDPLAPGTAYTAALTGSEKVALHRVEVTRMSGNGRLRITGQPDRPMRDSIVTAFDYVRAHKRDLGVDQDLDSYDFHVQVVDLMAGKEGSEAGVAFFVALYSLLKERPVQPGLVILGEMTIHGNVLPVRALAEPLQVAMDNGAKRVLIPVASRRHFLEVPGDVVEKVDPIFYSDPLTAALKGLGIN
jgi:ATP-dependent Lon protease